MIDLHKKFRGSGYLIVDSEYDATNIICRNGHIYADGQRLVASLDNASLADRRAMKKLGEVVADGDFGELSVRFHPDRFNDVAAILKPRQASVVRPAA